MTFAICLDLRVYNEPCTDRTENARRELAHVRALDGLDVYGERRDSEQKAKRLRTCRHGSLLERALTGRIFEMIKVLFVCHGSI